MPEAQEITDDLVAALSAHELETAVRPRIRAFYVSPSGQGEGPMIATSSPRRDHRRRSAQGPASADPSADPAIRGPCAGRPALRSADS